MEDTGLRLAPEAVVDRLQDAVVVTRTGVYAGISNNEYRGLIVDAFETTEPAAGLYSVTGTSFNTAIGRVAYALGLQGPAIALDTACSSSLVAVHQAAVGLQRGEADLALAGGVHAILSGRYVAWLDEHAAALGPDGSVEEGTLADMAWTAGVGRSHLPHRAGVPFTDVTSLRSALEGLAASEIDDGVAGLDVSAPSCGLVSSMTGRLTEPGAPLDGSYWCRQARAPVAFRDSVVTLADQGTEVVVEIGPHAVLGPVVLMCWPERVPTQPVSVASLQRPPGGQPADGPAGSGFVEAVARLYEAGAAVAFEGLFAGESRRRVALPG
ncbi:MAG: beta-ketoacyl synthase N-terminal-like domain-containing protein [bacterium]|nr:beta-ketoacyl synthase N-terminal-like domain-containing protein [bacterium]